MSRATDWRRGQTKGGRRFSADMHALCLDCEWGRSHEEVSDGNYLRRLARDHAMENGHTTEVAWTRGIRYHGRETT